MSELLLAVGLACAAPQAGRAAGHSADPLAGRVLITLDEALKLCFGEAGIERGTVYLTEQQIALAGELSREPISAGVVHPYRATRDGELVGTAWVDVHRVRSLRETVLVVVGPDQRVRRVELLAFGEPEEYAPRGNWYGQFVGLRLDDELDLRRGIRGVTGATLTARATTAAVRRVLALQRVIYGAPPATPDSPPARAP